MEAVHRRNSGVEAARSEQFVPVCSITDTSTKTIPNLFEVPISFRMSTLGEFRPMTFSLFSETFGALSNVL